MKIRLSDTGSSFLFFQGVTYSPVLGIAITVKAARAFSPRDVVIGRHPSESIDERGENFNGRSSTALLFYGKEARFLLCKKS
jgi:hypothetical protein